MDTPRWMRVTGWTALAVGAVAAVGALVVRDQMSRHRRDLFSPHALRRLAALGYLSGQDADVDTVRLLRDYVGWEPRPLIRRRAIQVLERMEHDLRDAGSPEGVAG